jgi:hypothetical protein
MKEQGEAWWEVARAARDRLVAQILAHPDVSLIDIGLDPLGTSETPVLRVHLRRGDGSALQAPDQIDGVPIRFMHGSYRLQQDGGRKRSKEVDE